MSFRTSQSATMNDSDLMQDRYAGDFGDSVKFALLRVLAPGEVLGVAWYLHPDEAHNGDGRHLSYLERPEVWRALDPELFGGLQTAVHRGRSVDALVAAGVLVNWTLAGERIDSRSLPARERPAWRRAWFARTLASLEGCTLVFADPDNGLVDDADHRRRQRTFGKHLPLSEARELSRKRTAVIYHHNTRRAGGHNTEVAFWREQLGNGTIAVRCTAWSCRTFFILNPTAEIRRRTEQFCEKWALHKVRLEG